MTLALPILNDRFAPLEIFQGRATSSYALLPFRFLPLDAERHILTNFAGEYAVLPKTVTRQLICHELPMHSPVYDDLKSRHFVLDGDSSVAIDLLATKYRTKQVLLSHFTSLFMFVVTLRCDHSCPYCQVSRQSHDRFAYDMNIDQAEKAIEFMFQSPSPAIKVEFQGGEPLLNFDLIRHITRQVERRNASANRLLQFVIATNLANVTDEILGFCRDHDIYISTSLDGPRELHNANRPRPGGDSYEKTIAGIDRVRLILGEEKVAALMTTTAASLDQPEAIVDEYVSRGFRSIFLRALSPFGFAVATRMVSRYTVDDWLTFYKRGLAYIIKLNEQGTAIREEYAALLLRKILTPWPTFYVDLQSPAGIGISCLVFNYDGDIYASDESRMLAEMGDRTFRLGNLMADDFASVMGSDNLVEMVHATMTEGMPMCADCGVQPYCGSDPVHHQATQGDMVGFKPTSDFCRKNMEIIRHLIRLLEDDEPAARVLRTWI